MEGGGRVSPHQHVHPHGLACSRRALQVGAPETRQGAPRARRAAARPARTQRRRGDQALLVQVRLWLDRYNLVISLIGIGKEHDYVPALALPEQFANELNSFKH